MLTDISLGVYWRLEDSKAGGVPTFFFFPGLAWKPSHMD